MISVICTVLNEEDTIEEFLKSIIEQRILPDEFIIVDGGSTDKTLEILKKYESKYPFIKVFRLDGANIADGRNFAIKNAKGIIIVTVDAGCKYGNNFIKEIVKPLLKFLLENYKKFGLKKSDIIKYIHNKGFSLDEILAEDCAEFVQGTYYPYSTNTFSYFAGFMLVKPIEKQCKVPSRTSARATAYFKYVWEAVGGYPNNYITGEDTKFHLNIIKHRFKWVCKNVEVYWKMPTNLIEFYKKFKKYAIGDILQRNIIVYRRLLIFFISFWTYILLVIYVIIFKKDLLLFLLLVIPVIIYLILLGIVYTIKLRNPLALFYLPLLEIVRRIAYQVGFLEGILRIILLKK